MQVTSRLRGGGRHKDKKSKVEKRQVTIQEPMSGMSQETPEKDEDKMIQLLDEDSMKAWVDFWSKGNTMKSDKEWKTGCPHFRSEQKWTMRVQTSGNVE